jgi:hypothetical protein
MYPLPSAVLKKIAVITMCPSSAMRVCWASYNIRTKRSLLGSCHVTTLSLPPPNPQPFRTTPQLYFLYRRFLCDGCYFFTALHTRQAATGTHLFVPDPLHNFRQTPPRSGAGAQWRHVLVARINLLPGIKVSFLLPSYLQVSRARWETFLQVVVFGDGYETTVHSWN